MLEIYGYQQGWNDAMMHRPPRQSGSAAYWEGYNDAKKRQ